MECHSVGTVVHMAVNGKYAGHILISDQIKPHAKEAIAALKKCGVKKTIMLTGDRREAHVRLRRSSVLMRYTASFCPATR